MDAQLDDLLRRGIDDPVLLDQIRRTLARGGRASVRRLYVPNIGDEIRLVADWTFPLHPERRNTELRDVLGIRWTDGEQSDWYFGRDAKPVDVTLVAGTVLKIDRIYIRQGGDRFASVTFRATVEIEPATGKRKAKYRKPRFWAKLADVNRILFETVGS